MASVDRGLLDDYIEARGPADTEADNLRLTGARPSALRRIKIRASVVRRLVRAVAWGIALMWLLLQWFAAWIARTGDIRRRAAQLAATMESLGGTMIKLGQQLSVRADLLPEEFCDALADLCDDVAPMPWPVAEAALREHFGQPVEEVFADLETTPIGTASIACVYGATTKDGRRVAVKVRRPDAPVRFSADVGVMRWLMRTGEVLGVFRKGYGTQIVDQIEHILAEELDFRLEARNQELFRRSLRKTRVKYVECPDVLHELSGESVIVSEFQDGIPMRKLLRDLESGAIDDAWLAERGIHRKKVAIRLLTAWNWQIFDFTLFHGDPHWSNVYVLSGSRIGLIDFGACGSFSMRSRRILRQIQYHLLNDDPREMTRAALQLLEPFPPIDVDSFATELEQLYTDYHQAALSSHSEWWERSTSKIWIDFARVARLYRVPVSQDTLRLFRATLLMDTIAFRLDPDLKLKKAYRRFLKEERKHKRREFEKDGFDDPLGRPVWGVERAVEVVHLAERGVMRLNSLLDARFVSFGLLPEKVMEILSSTIKGVVGLAAALVLLAAFGEFDVLEEHVSWLHERSAGFIVHTFEVAKTPTFQVVALFVVLFWLYKLRRRLGDVSEPRR